MNFDNLDNFVSSSIFLFILFIVVIHFLTSIIVQILTWIDDGEGELFKGKKMLGIDLGQLSTNDVRYDGKSKKFLAPYILLGKSEIKNGKSRAPEWFLYLVCCFAITILSIPVAYFWKTSLLGITGFGVIFLTRRIVRLVKKARQAPNSTRS